jgi:hypothetical protein
MAQRNQQKIKNGATRNAGWLTQRQGIVPTLGARDATRESEMAQYDYYLFDAESRMVQSQTAEHRDILDALERMRTLLAEFEAIAMVQLWQQENFIGHITRTEGRLILKRQSDPLPGHPVFNQNSRETKAS